MRGGDPIGHSHSVCVPWLALQPVRCIHQLPRGQARLPRSSVLTANCPHGPLHVNSHSHPSVEGDTDSLLAHIGQRGKGIIEESIRRCLSKETWMARNRDAADNRPVLIDLIR